MISAFPAFTPFPFHLVRSWAMICLATAAGHASEPGGVPADPAELSLTHIMSRRTTAASTPPAEHEAEAGADAGAEAGGTVMLIHGLGRSRLSMSWLGRQLEQAGYNVINVGYPSTRLSVADAARHLHTAIAPHLGPQAGRVHFVTHSLGGIVLRALLQAHRPARLGRVVMLAPPNQGSEVADRLVRNPAYRWATGPAGQELGTDAASTPNQLGPVVYDVGVIAGRASLNPLFSSWLKGPNDGKVSVARTTVAGQRDHLVINHSHTYLMRSREVADQTLHFIALGRFQRRTATSATSNPSASPDLSDSTPP